MSHLQVLDDIAERGLRLSAAGADLRLLGPRERMDPDLIGRIKAHKAELLAFLAPPAADDAGHELTPLQRAYLVGREADGGTVASHVYSEIEGCWDIDRLEEALRAVVARHGMLRTRFTASGQQVEDPSASVRVGRLDLRGLDPAAQDARLAKRRDEWSHRVLPADRAPMLAVDVTILADDRMILHISQDGLVLDAISTFLLHRAWVAGYRGEPVDVEDEMPFAAYVDALAVARTRPPAQRSRDYWLARVDDLAPPPRLPLKASPPTAPRFTPRLVRLDPAQWAALKARASDAGVTPSGALMAAYAEALAACGAGARFTLTTTFANRPPIHPRIFHAMGSFSDTALVEVDIDPAATFAERAAALAGRLRRDLDHRHVSGVDVLRELGRRHGPARAHAPYTFNSAIGYVHGDVDASALEALGRERYSVSQTPQVWVNVFAAEAHGGLVVKIDGIDEMFPDGLLDTLAYAYRRLLALLADPWAWSSRTFDLLPPAQRARRDAANATAVPRRDELLTDAFVRHAAAAPDATAVVSGEVTLTYAEVLRQAWSAAEWLRGHGVARDELVALVMRRGAEQVVGIVAALLAGAAYLPVDAGLPEARRAYMLRDGRVRCALTNVGWRGNGVAVLDVDAAAPAGSAPGPGPATLGPSPLAPKEATPDDLAYVLYTSGTTGDPKGVTVTHRAVANVVADCAERFGLTAGDRLFGISAFTFDLSAYDVFGALSSGAAIVLPDADLAADAAHWTERCRATRVTVWNSVPALASLLVEQAAAEGPDAVPDLRLVMMSGDRIPPDLPLALRRQWPRAALVSLGGPTETTIWNIWHPIGEAGEPIIGLSGTDDDGSRPIPYGRPTANNRAYVLDEHGRDMPDGVPGEICAAGLGLARGYWADPARTAERFIHDPLRGRLFRTGDIGRYLPDGAIDILGRADHQIKVNGYRIEAGEVETRLVAIDGVAEAAVVGAAGAGGARLVAHLTGPSDTRPDDGALRRALAVHLPDYMVPSVFVWHDALPLTRNGKVDRGTLAAPAPPAPAAPPTPGYTSGGTVADIATIWASVLRLPDVAGDARFLDIGGDSITAARIVSAVRKRYGVTIPLHRLAEVDTVTSMARYVDGAIR
jgi:amino acid adenylation domain-containing protein